MLFLKSKWPNDLESQGQWPPFSILTNIIPRCIFGANLGILAQMCDELWRGQAKFPRILSQNGHNDLHFQYRLRVSQDACLVQIWWFQPKILWRVIVRTSKSLRTDRRTDRRRQRQYPLGLKVQGVKFVVRQNYYSYLAVEGWAQDVELALVPLSWSTL